MDQGNMEIFLNWIEFSFFFPILGGMGTLIVFGGILSIIVTGIVFTTIMCYLRIRGKQQHVTHAESRSGNKNLNILI